MFCKKVNVTNALKLQVKHFCNSCVTYRSHYDSLGLTPNATQADIKNAYYNLSKVYHPDKNKGSADASKKFHDISNAYEVLGNFKLRKMYDKGLLPQSGAQHTPEDFPDHPEVKFYQSRDIHQRKSTMNSAGTKMYDIDEWSKAHYGATFQRRYEAKQKWESKQFKNQQVISDLKTEKVLMTLFSLITLGLVVGFMQEDYDKVDNVRKK